MQGADGTGAAGVGLQQLQASRGAVVKPALDVLRFDAVVQHGGANAALHFIEIVLEADDQNMATNMHMLASDRPAGCRGKVLDISNSGFAGASLRDQS